MSHRSLQTERSMNRSRSADVGGVVASCAATRASIGSSLTGVLQARRPAASRREAIWLQQNLGNRQVGRLLKHAGVQDAPVARQTTAGPPGGPDPCLDLLQQIIDLLNEVAGRINEALDDRHELFRHHRRVGDAHPEHGSWDGHRDRFYYDRDRLRHKIAEWDSNDRCRGYRLSREQQAELEEANSYKDREFPDRPARAMRQVEEGPGLRERIAEILIDYGVPAFAVSMLVGLVIAALADPEPVSKVALIVGSAAAIAIFIAIGRGSDAPPSA